MGRRAGGNRNRADGPEGAGRGLRRAWHHRLDQLPPERARGGARLTWPPPSRTRGRVGLRSIPPLILARSLDREQAGDLSGALAVLTAAFDGNPDDLGEIEDLLGDAVRLALTTGDKCDRADAGRAGGRARRRIADTAPAGQRALLPRPGRPGRRHPARGRAAVRRRQPAAPPGQGARGGGRVPGRGRGPDRRAARVRAGGGGRTSSSGPRPT